MTTRKETSKVTKERLEALPRKSGVYLMKDAGGEVLYVGKAKDLRSRVRSYFSGSDERHNVQFLIERIDSVETLVTEDERQAIVLESDLIKKYKPRYNIRLKDDKAHLIVRIDMSHQWPRLDLVRSVKDDGARYIGPFAFSYELRTLLEVLKKTIPLRTCSNNVIYNRVRPCLEYQIKRCSAPCCLDVDHAQYLGWVEQAVRILEGHTEEVVKELRHDMDKASEELRYEDAATIRDRIQILERIGEEKASVQFGSGGIDAFGFYREGGNIELSVLMVRFGRLFESKTYGFSQVEVSDDEMLCSVLTQFYDGSRDFPDQIILPIEIEDIAVRRQWYSEQAEKTVELIVPKRGSKRRLLELALTNSKQNFEARFSDQNRSDRILEALRVELDLEEAPRTIECVDISHFQGGSTVGAVVSFKDMKPNKKRYRSFHLSQEVNDDFASMREVVSRHLSRCAEENTIADLMVIDGGVQQLAVARKVRSELGLERPNLIGLAKKRKKGAHYRAYEGAVELGAVRKPERIFVEDSNQPIVLNVRSEALQLLERIRNEAHRSAVTFHRKTRNKKSFKSVLDSVPGIGPKRRTDLLREFGSVAAIRAASAQEINQRCGLPIALAQRLLSAIG